MINEEVRAALARRISLGRAVLAENAVEPSYAQTLARALDRVENVAPRSWAAAQNRLTMLLTCVDRRRISPELWAGLAESERELIRLAPVGLDLPDLVDPDVAYEQRNSARVLLVDAEDRVLLFRQHAPETPERSFWFTVGGGLDPGEEPVAGAARELTEETGLVVPPSELVGPVWTRREQFRFAGVAMDSVEQFFLLRLGQQCEVDTGGFTELELETIDHHYWWSASELSETREWIFPYQLPELLPQVLDGEWDGITRTVH